MSRFRELDDFNRRFDSMELDELKRWKKHWTQHAQYLGPKVRKEAMKRIHNIDKAILSRQVE